MNSLESRAKITYVVLTATICAISLSMSDSGADYPTNPAWQLVSAVRWVLITIGTIWAILWLLVKLAEMKPESREESKRPLQVTPIQRAEPIPMVPTDTEVQENKQQRDEETVRVKALQAEALQRQRTEQKVSRSTEEATKDALDDFL